MLCHVYHDVVSTLPDSLKSEVSSLGLLLNEARSSSTVTSYTLGFKRFTDWAESHDLPTSLPIEPLHCALYLLSLIQTCDSISQCTRHFIAYIMFISLLV